jgi:16S rRNA (cytidine1402-2'-O)-methyltransferase
LHRTLTDLAEACGGDRLVVLAREMTKLHEEMWRGTLTDAVTHSETVEPRGEYAIVIAPFEQGTVDVTDEDIRHELALRLQGGFSKRGAIDEVTAALGIARKRVYAIAVET